MDYDKLWSLINKSGVSKSAAAKIVGMSHTGFVYMMDRKTMTVEALELFCKYFGVSIATFFESSPKIYKVDDQVLKVEESKGGYCTACAAKDKLIALQEKHIELLEFNLGKYRKNGSE